MDEWFLAGDAAFLEKARHRLEEMVRGADILVLSSHQADIVQELVQPGALAGPGARSSPMAPPTRCWTGTWARCTSNPWRPGVTGSSDAAA